MVGFNFAGFLFVVTKTISKEKDLGSIQVMLQSNKIKNFNWYCATNPRVIGEVGKRT